MNCYCSGHIQDRKETWSEENPSDRWRKYSAEELLSRDKTSLDITWIKDKDDLEDVSLKDLMATIEEKSAAIATAVSSLKTLVGDIHEN